MTVRDSSTNAVQSSGSIRYRSGATRYASDPSAFRDDLTVDVDGVARRFGDVVDPWQRDDFAAIDPALMRCNGRQPQAEGRSRFYCERPRGASKTTDLAVTAVWAMAFAARPIRGYCYAADKDQAAILKDAMATIVRLNPWLADILGRFVCRPFHDRILLLLPPGIRGVKRRQRQEATRNH